MLNPDKTKPAAMVVAGYFFGGNFRLRLLKGTGFNHIFLAEAPGAKIVIRLTNPTYFPALKRSTQAVAAALNARLPAPEILLTGISMVPFGYQVLEYVEGQSGDKYKGDKIAVWSEAGYLARQINQIATHGYDNDLFLPAWQQPSWRDFISQSTDKQMKFYRRYRLPGSLKPIFNKQELKIMRGYLDSLPDISQRPCLVHLDYSLRNMILDDNGQIKAVIDWDSANSYPQPHQVAFTTFWLSPEETEAFTRSYGIHYDQSLLTAFQIHEVLNQLPLKEKSVAKVAVDILKWRLVSDTPPPELQIAPGGRVLPAHR